MHSSRARWCALACAVIVHFSRWSIAHAFALWAVEHRPTYKVGESGFIEPSTPTDLRLSRLFRDGNRPGYDSSIAFSRFTHIGCFKADISIQKHLNTDSNYDPNECVEYCEKVAFPNASHFEVIAAVHQDRCGCVLNDMTEFQEVDKGFCTFYCKFYRNPLCGGYSEGNYFWGVFKEYDYQSLGAQGTYDPGRYMWYTVVVIKESSIQGALLAANEVQPERYYLHAVNANSGLAQFQFQMPIEKGILYGIQYDIDSSRLAALHTPADTGRMRQDAEWQYKLATIVVNTTDGTLPQMQLSLAPISISLEVSQEYLAFSGASAIVSRKVNCYIFTQSEPASLKKDMKDRMYFVRIPDGFIIHEVALDFKVMQILANEVYGDVSAVGPRREVSLNSGQQNYVYLGRVFRSEIEDETVVDWMYSPLNPGRLVPLSVSGEWLLHPGISASDHLFNKSAISYRYIPEGRPDLAATTIMEVNIRTGTSEPWCDELICQGSLDNEVPYSGLFNREPGIPLTLKAPSFLSARFTIEAHSIIVDWDRATLQGARTIDEDGDLIPDYIDYSTRPAGEFDCGEVFDLVSVLKLGPYPETNCHWQSASRIIISLPTTGINITVGDDLFVLPDTIYAPPLADEWSPAATGGVQVEVPFPLEAPVIVLSGPTTIDQCTEVTLDATGSFQTGGLPRYIWAFPESTDEEENPKDLTNSPTRSFDQDKLEAMKETLAEATLLNSPTLVIAAPVLEEAASYVIRLTVTSRWQVSMNKTVLLTKLRFSVPMVFISGEEVRWKNRTERVALEAVGTPSSCEGSSDTLSYQWLCTSGNLNFEDYPVIKPDVHTLVIPPFVLLPPVDGDTSEYNVYNFTVECWDKMYPKVPERTAFASVTVRVRRSPVHVVFRTGSRVLHQGDLLVLDARFSQDPDFPTLEEHTFKGDFQWQCLTPQPRQACFGPSSTGMITEVSKCRQDPGNVIQDGLKSFYAPLFDDLVYCQYARGVMMFQTKDFELGQYKFSVEITSYDGRKANADVYIDITDVEVPKIVLQLVPLKERYTISESIRIVGTEEGSTLDVARTYSWNVSVYERNPEYQNEQALAMGNDPENPYTVDMFTYIDVTSSYDTRDAERFDSSSSSPNLKIKENVLQASKTYNFRLNIHVGPVTGFSDITFRTAGLKPRGGRLEVDIVSASMDTPRKITAPAWVADDLPLAYDFGYMASYPGEISSFPLSFKVDPSPVADLTVDTLPLGDPATNYSLLLFVHVSTPYGAVETEFTTIQSLPPENVTESVIQALARAEDIDAASLLTLLDHILSMDPENFDLHDSIVDVMTRRDDEIPITPNQLVMQARILAKIVGAGNVRDNVLAALESLVLRAAEGNFFTPDNTLPEGPLASLVLSALGGLLPGGGVDDLFGGGDSDGPAGQSTVMGRYLSPNPSFAFRDEGSSGGEDADLQLQWAASRQRVNHPSPVEKQHVITSCQTAFCDQPLLACYARDRPGAAMYICCDESNPNTLCNDPPCWFRGIRCPAADRALIDRRPLRAHDRDQALRQRRLHSAQARPQRRGKQRSQWHEEASSDTVAARSFGGTWLDSWVEYHFPLHTLNEEDISDWERVNGFHGWNPNIYKRKLQALAINRTQSDAERILALEAAEKELLQKAQELESQRSRQTLQAAKAAATEQVSFDSMAPQLAQRLRDQTIQDELSEEQYKEEYAQNASARITRITVMRNTIAKALIRNLVSNEEPLVFTSTAYTLTIGKTTNLSNVHSAFVFPEAFQVPADSPDDPTPESNVTGFAFQYVEYKKNIYDWSDSNPASNETLLVTLAVMKANTNDLEVRQSPDPIRVFADRVLLSNAICLFWDRFAPNTPGGKWSSQGIVNNGTGCITTHLTDIAVFMDGRMFSGSSFVEAASNWEREVFESTCIGCGREMNLFVIVVLGMVLFMNLLLVLLGYVLDESRRSEMKRNRVTSRYFYDGDGLEKPLNVDDPIAYSSRDNFPLLCFRTLLNVTVREHAVIATLFYHETFTRPQRMWCFGALLMGLMGINAVVHGNPGYMQEASQYIISGVLSGLLVFPVFCGLLLMFNMRPSAIKKRLIKRAYSTREIDYLNEQRQRQANRTALRPAASYLTLPPPPGDVPGQTTLLALPAPLPLPPMPLGAMPGVPALPPPAGGLPSMLALPAVPGMTANMPLPPPPKYPPPPKNAKVPPPSALMPPLVFKPGPPPPPFPRGHLPDASIGGTYTNLPLPGAPDTGATPLQLPDVPHGAPLPALGLTGEAPATPPTPQGAPRSYGADLALPGGLMEAEAMTPPAFIAREEGRHGAPPDLPGAVSNDPSMPTPMRPPGSMTPPGMSPRTPHGGTPTGGTPMGGTPRSEVIGAGPRGGHSTPGSYRSGVSRGGLPSALVPQDAELAMPLFIRGAPPPGLPSPIPTAPPLPGGTAPWLVPGLPPPGLQPPVPSAKGFPMPMPGAPLPPMQPIPPPPPREDDQAFVRRIKLTYSGKVMREHEKHDILEDMDKLGTHTPEFVFDAMTVLPYLACFTFTVASVVVVLQYGVKFQKWQEDYWVKGSLIGLGVVLLLLELLRIVMMTLIELRMFENRKKAKAGHFLPRRVKRDDDKHYQEVPPPRLLRRAFVSPAVPKGALESNRVARPAFLPQEAKLPALPPGARTPPEAMTPPGLRPGGPGGAALGNLPVAREPPAMAPQFSAQALGFGDMKPPPMLNLPRGVGQSPGPATPKTDRSMQGTGGSLGGVVGPSLGMGPPGTPPGGGAGTPKLQSAGELLRQGSGAMAPPSPTHSTHSLRSAVQSLNQQVKAGRRNTPPPRPAQPRSAGAHSRPAQPPPAPSDPPPNWNRPPSRPTSANSTAAPSRFAQAKPKAPG